MSGIGDCDVIILCGGLGTRLQALVRDRPKPMADIHGRPFIALIVEHLSRHGARRFIFSTGHRGDMIEDWFRHNKGAYETLFVRDPFPLGTGGALANAMKLSRSNPVLLLNGDSFCEVDPARLLRFHALKRARATIAVTKPDERQDAGAVVLDADDRVQSMVEKPRLPKMGYHNSGMYVLDRSVQSFFPRNDPWSLERDLLPSLTAQGFYGFVTASLLYDIGTPERLAQFRDGRQEAATYATTLSVRHERGLKS
ncbi:MAG: putative Nucleotidyl transferase [Nitrospira sp.]|jgi:NDP-sugar pyrophosphorylase family protein|nr:putative Nucleotidyl transferase [Nitrospira sp.]